MTMAVTWEIAGHVATIAQLTGLDAAGLIDLIYNAASNARMHKSRCCQFAEWLKLVGNVLKPIMNAEWMKIPENEEILEKLEGALRRARDLVDSCQNSSYPYLVVTHCIFAERLRQSQEDIEKILQLFHIAANHTQIAVIFPQTAAICTQPAATPTTKEAATEGFKQLLKEASKDITSQTKYKNFAKKWGHDKRFKDLDRRGRELLLKERVDTLKKASKKELKAKHVSSNANFKDMLRERGTVNLSSHWSQVQDSFCNDSRYKAVKRRDRKTLFNELMAEMRATEVESIAKERSENKVESSAEVYMHKVLGIMAYPLQKIFNYQPVCVRDGSEFAHEN